MGDWTSPNKALVNHNVSIGFGSLSFIQWKRSASLSSSLMRSYRKACFISLYSTTVDSVMPDQSLSICLMKGWSSLIWLGHHTLFAFWAFCVFSDNSFMWNIIFFTIWLVCCPFDDSFSKLIFDDVVLFNFSGSFFSFPKRPFKCYRLPNL